MIHANAVAPRTGFVTPSAGFRSLHSEEVRGFRPWKDFVHDNFPWLEHRDHGDGNFRATVSAYRLGNGALTTISAGASEVIRTPHLADTADAGFIKLIWQMAGDMRLEQDSRSCTIEPGQTTVCDTARPYRLRLSEGAHFAVLMLPHDACPGWERISQKICGARLGDTVTMRAAFGALSALIASPAADQQDGATDCAKDSVREAAKDTVFRAVQLMITSSLHHSASELGITNLHNVRLNKAQQHILEHISDPGLDADELAAALCMSRRSLYMLFKEYQLTPSKMIHDLRLEGSREALGDASKSHRKITDIAFDHGFNDYATFSRLFKAQFGVTPSEYRLKTRPPRQ